MIRVQLQWGNYNFTFFQKPREPTLNDDDGALEESQCVSEETSQLVEEQLREISKQAEELAKSVKKVRMLPQNREISEFNEPMLKRIRPTNYNVPTSS